MEHATFLSAVVHLSRVANFGSSAVGAFTISTDAPSWFDEDNCLAAVAALKPEAVYYFDQEEMLLAYIAVSFGADKQSAMQVHTVYAASFHPETWAIAC